MIPVKKIRDNFSQAASWYERYADIQNKLAQELLEELVGGGYQYQSILDVGCATGWLLEGLKRYFPKSRRIGLDISFEMIQCGKVKIHNGVVADGVSLPFENDSFDLVLSNAVYQWIPDLEKAFREVSRILKQGGFFIFNCFGSKTLNELRSCFEIKENFLPTGQLVKEGLEKAGFLDLEFKVSLRNKYFDNLVDILSWLKYIGVNRVNAHTKMLTPQRLAKANYMYSSNYRSNGKVYASFEVIQVKARKL